MNNVVLFHHVLGLTPGIEAFSDELRRAGHTVLLPDLFDGETFASVDEGIAHVESTGIDSLVDAGVRFASREAGPTVYGGFSLGALIAHKLAQTEPDARGALFYHYGDVPMTQFDTSWPDSVPVQFHISEQDQWREAGVVEAFVAAVQPVASAGIFEYPGSAHLFTDSTSAEFDADSTNQVIARTVKFLDSLS